MDASADLILRLVVTPPQGRCWASLRHRLHRSRRDHPQRLSVRGLSTAATLWLGAALGLAAGAGLYVIVIAATVLVLLILVVLEILERAAHRVAPNSGTLEVRYARGHSTVGPLLRALEEVNARITGIRIEDDDVDATGPGVRIVSVRATFRHGTNGDHIAAGLAQRPEVEQVEWLRSSGRPQASPGSLLPDLFGPTAPAAPETGTAGSSARTVSGDRPPR